MTDITNEEDIKFLLDNFYQKVLKDHQIAYIFTDIAKINLQEHMPRIYRFWESVLLHKAGYSGNPILTHIELDKKVKLKDEHFEQWKKLFVETLDQHFEGANVLLAKQRVDAMIFLMKMKINDAQKNGFIQ
ncbi:MAG: group III truncated hemoglobin [Chitinophagaceae bacterium]